MFLIDRLSRGVNALACAAVAMGIVSFAAANDEVEFLELDVIHYDDFVAERPEAMKVLNKALYEKGIVGIKGVPGYRELQQNMIESSRAFNALPEEEKDAYAPNIAQGDTFLGYERGKEKFRRPDGRWVVDDLKVSYYAYIPDNTKNKWPFQMDLTTPFEEMGGLMREMSKLVMRKIGMGPAETGISLDETPAVGRLLYYCKKGDTSGDNPLWCGSHFDHGMFTALLPAFYFKDGMPVPEPVEAGLYVRTDSNSPYKKVRADDPDVMMFQVGEFGQLVLNDAIRATEHQVRKADGEIERYTMAVFINAPLDATIHSHSVLAQDPRYGAAPGEACTYEHWELETFKLFLYAGEDNQKQ